MKKIYIPECVELLRSKLHYEHANKGIQSIGSCGVWMRDLEESIVSLSLCFLFCIVQSGISYKFLFISGLLLMLNGILVKVEISIVFLTVLSRDNPQASGILKAFR